MSRKWQVHCDQHGETCFFSHPMLGNSQHRREREVIELGDDVEPNEAQLMGIYFTEVAPDTAVGDHENWLDRLGSDAPAAPAAPESVQPTEPEPVIPDPEPVIPEPETVNPDPVDPDPVDPDTPEQGLDV